MLAKIVKTAAAAMLVAFCSMSLTGCDAPTPAPPSGPAGPTESQAVATPSPQSVAVDYGLVNRGALTVCADVPFAPFVIENPASPSHYSGFDVELIQTVADRLGLRLNVVVVDFTSMLSGVAMTSGKCDFAATAITITEDRKAKIDFSNPYFDSAQSLMARDDANVLSLADLAGKRIGVQTGTTGKTLAAAHAPKNAKIIDYPSDAELWQALQNGDIDAIVEDFPVTKLHEKTNPDFQVVATYPTDEQYGFAFAKGDKPLLLAALNTELADLRADGTYFKLYGKYFG